MKIDELVLSLVLDVAGLKKGQAATEAALASIRAESEKTDKTMREGAKKTAEAQQKQGEGINKNAKATANADKKTQDGAKNNTHAYGKWLSSILSIGAAMVVLNKFKNFAIDLTNSDAAAGRMAENIGMATRDLTAFGNTADKLGGSAGEMTSDLFKMSQAIVALRAGGELPDWLTDPKGFFKLGGDMLPKLLDDSVSMLEKVKMIQERVQAVPAPVAQYAAGKLGLGVGTVTAFHDASWQRQLAIQYKLNAANAADAKLAQKRQIAWKSVQDTVESLGRGVVTKLSPAFLKLTESLIKFLSDGKNLKQIQKLVDDIGRVVGAVAKVIGTVAEGISQLFDLATGNKPADRGFLGNMLNILSRISTMITTIIDSFKQLSALVMPSDTAGNTGTSAGSKNVFARVSDQVLDNMLKLVWAGYKGGAAFSPDMGGSTPSAGRGMSLFGGLSTFGDQFSLAGPSAGQRASAGTGGTVNNYYNSGNTTNDVKMTVPVNQVGEATRSLNAKPLGGRAPALANGMQ